jgi:hypothetical protein
MKGTDIERRVWSFYPYTPLGGFYAYCDWM